MEGKERKETEHTSSVTTCNEALSEGITDVNKVLDTLDLEQRYHHCEILHGDGV